MSRPLPLHRYFWAALNSGVADAYHHYPTCIEKIRFVTNSYSFLFHLASNNWELKNGVNNFAGFTTYRRQYADVVSHWLVSVLDVSKMNTCFKLFEKPTQRRTLCMLSIHGPRYVHQSECCHSFVCKQTLWLELTCDIFFFRLMPWRIERQERATRTKTSIQISNSIFLV